MDKNEIKKEFANFIDNIPENNLGYKKEVVNKNLFYIQVFNQQQEAEDLIEVNTDE